MNGLIRASLNNIHAVIVFVLTLIVLGSMATFTMITAKTTYLITLCAMS